MWLWILSYILLVKPLHSQHPFRWVVNTHKAQKLHLFFSTLQHPTSLVYGPELTGEWVSEWVTVSEALNPTCSWTIFSSLFSLLPFVILSCCTQAPSEVQWSSDSNYQSKTMVSIKVSESFTWIRELLMTRLTSSLHSATPGLWSSRFDEKASW